MSKPLPTDDFRAVRIVLEPEDFALTDGVPDVPDDLIDRETWNGIMVLPDDVAIRTSNHKGRWLKELYHQQALWTEHAVGIVQTSISCLRQCSTLWMRLMRQHS